MLTLIAAKSLLSKALPFLFVAGAVVGTLGITYHMGKSSVQAKWDLEKAETKAMVNYLEGKLFLAQKDHEIASKEVATHLSNEKEIYEKAMRDSSGKFSSRLRESETRSTLYKHLSEAGEAERERLASYAAGLDRSLVEGKEVAADLRRTLEFRDKQVILLGQQINADRKLKNE